jgi:hypothetical protein
MRSHRPFHWYWFLLIPFFGTLIPIVTETIVNFSYYWPGFIIALFFFWIPLIIVFIVGAKSVAEKESFYKLQKSSTEEIQKHQLEAADAKCAQVGDEGERLVADIIEQTIVGKHYLYNDVIVRGNDGKTSQIDHILVSAKGVFVIETKNFSRKIYGNEDDYEWRRTLGDGRPATKFYNPCMQNKQHVQRLSDYLKMDDKIYSAVVFAHGDISDIAVKSVLTLSDLKDLLSESSPDMISEMDLDRISGMILQMKVHPVQSEEEHRVEAKTTKQNISNGICPRCGGKLVLRTSKNGWKFYGCENYPHCHFTKRL